MTAKKIHRKRARSTLGIMPLLFIFGFASGYFYYEGQLPTVFSSETESPALNVCFSPEGQCEKLALHAIQSAKKEILVQCYSFTSRPISDALINNDQDMRDAA